MKPPNSLTLINTKIFLVLLTFFNAKYFPISKLLLNFAPTK